MALITHCLSVNYGLVALWQVVTQVLLERLKGGESTPERGVT